MKNFKENVLVYLTDSNDHQHGWQTKCQGETRIFSHALHTPEILFIRDKRKNIRLRF